MWPTTVNICDNTLFEALALAPVCLGMVLTYKLLRFPDITMEGSFVLGAAITAVLVTRLGCPVGVATCIGVLAGSAAGLLTGFLHITLRIDKLLAGVLSSFACYSVSLLVMGAYVGYGDRWTLLTPFEEYDRNLRQYLPAAMNLHLARIAFLGTVVIIIKGILDLGLKTEKGLVLTAVGHNESVVIHCGVNPSPYRLFALAASNGLVALSGILVSMKEGGASPSRGIGLIIFALTAYVLGERALRGPDYPREAPCGPIARAGRWLLRWRGRVELSTAAIGGALLYFLVLQGGYAFGVRPELPKLVMCAIVIMFIGDRQHIFFMSRRRAKSANARTA